MRSYMGYQEEPINVTATIQTIERLDESWVLLDNEDNVEIIDIDHESEVDEATLKRRKIWRKRLRKAANKQTPSSPVCPPRARIVRRKDRQPKSVLNLEQPSPSEEKSLSTSKTLVSTTKNPSPRLHGRRPVINSSMNFIQQYKKTYYPSQAYKLGGLQQPTKNN